MCFNHDSPELARPRNVNELQALSSESLPQFLFAQHSLFAAISPQLILRFHQDYQSWAIPPARSRLRRAVRQFPVPFWDHFGIADQLRTTPFTPYRERASGKALALRVIGTNPTGELITSGLPVTGIATGPQSLPRSGLSGISEI